MSRRSLRWIPEEEVSSKRENSFRVAALEEFGVGTSDILSLKQEEKHSGRQLVRALGGCWRRQCPPKEKNHLR